MLEELGIDWTPLHAPEPITVLPWLLENRERAADEGRLLIMHPDPPLGTGRSQGPERAVRAGRSSRRCRCRDTADLHEPGYKGSLMTVDGLVPSDSLRDLRVGPLGLGQR